MRLGYAIPDSADEDCLSLTAAESLASQHTFVCRRSWGQEEAEDGAITIVQQGHDREA